jgi:phage replication-related protein YjqB (UPF0714/DUF867 family)
VKEYSNFAALSAAEREGQDFEIVCCPKPSPVAIIAPHGGGIEPSTSRIAAAIAGDDFNLYLFEGRKREGNTRLHITSRNFDEPRCLALIAPCDYVVAVHGCDDRDGAIYLGGLDAELRDAIGEQLRAAKFHAGPNPKPFLDGVSPGNICNKGHRHRGVQLELSRDLRDKLKDNAYALATFATAIRAALTPL